MNDFIKWRSERGSSLVEIIASILIISVLSLFFMKMFYQAEQTSATSDRKLIAANLARQIAVQYEKVDFQTTLGKLNSGTLTVTRDSTDPTLPIPTDSEINGTTFHSQVELVSLATDSRLSSYSDRMFKARVTVFWDDATNKRTSSTVETFVTREDIRR
ncbi:type IV pilus modification PilV family protein [Brevibacillus ginsengisoli]|uniref:type IV pilus modification PilV family protein n=1 Tax=Brevibacillus ginsengisoli TaxID=363854 RepID=UPI003CEB334E